MFGIIPTHLIFLRGVEKYFLIH